MAIRTLGVVLKFLALPVGSVTGACPAETVCLSKGYAPRIKGVVLVGDAAVKVRKEVVGILHFCPQVVPGVVFEASAGNPDLAGIVQMAAGIRGVGEASETDFAFDEGLEPAPVTRGVDQAASTIIKLILGREIVSAPDHGVTFRNE